MLAVFISAKTILRPLYTFMPSKSKSQQRIMGWAHACQTGRGSNCGRIGKLVGSIDPKDAEDFARTKHDGLPERVKKKKHKKKAKSFREFVEEQEMKSFDQWQEAITSAEIVPDKNRLKFRKIGPATRMNSRVRAGNVAWDRRVGDSAASQSVNARLHELVDEITSLVGSDPTSIRALQQDQQLLTKLVSLIGKIKGDVRGGLSAARTKDDN